jgi:hypothetical protein
MDEPMPADKAKPKRQTRTEQDDSASRFVSALNANLLERESESAPHYQLRRIRKDDFIAEYFETKASLLPRSMKAEADTHRATAKGLRESNDSTIIYVANAQPE